MNNNYIIGITVGTCAVTVIAYKLLRIIQNRKLRDAWSNAGKDVVVLHQFKRGKCCPNLSPFVMKVESFLRLANIKYIDDFEKPFSSKGKCPWITLNGEDVADSEFAIEKLKDFFGVDLDSHLSPVEAAHLYSLRVLVDEHLFWCLAFWRYAIDKSKSFLTTQNLGFFGNFIMKFVLPTSFRKRAVVQGIGRHSDQEIMAIGDKDLQILSQFLGDSKFFGGDSPCTADCAIFGMLAQVMWNSPGSHFLRSLLSTHNNLAEYCQRMKEKVYPDWNDLLLKNTD